MINIFKNSGLLKGNVSISSNNISQLIPQIIKQGNIYCSDLDKTILTVDITEGTGDFIGIVEHLYNLNKDHVFIQPTLIFIKNIINDYL